MYGAEQHLQNQLARGGLWVAVRPVQGRASRIAVFARGRRPSQNTAIQTGRLSTTATMAMPGGPNRPAGSDAATVAAPSTSAPDPRRAHMPEPPQPPAGQRQRQAADRRHDQRRHSHERRRRPLAGRPRRRAEADRGRYQNARRQPQQRGGVEGGLRPPARGAIRHAFAYSRAWDSISCRVMSS